MAQAAQIDRLQDALRMTRLELRIESARVERLVQHLSRILMLLPPEPIMAGDGKVYWYRDPWPQRLLDMLAAEIRAIPEQLAAESVAQHFAMDPRLTAQSNQQAQTTGVPLTKTEPRPVDDGDVRSPNSSRQ
jgi:hypothetical protein